MVGVASCDDDATCWSNMNLNRLITSLLKLNCWTRSHLGLSQQSEVIHMQLLLLGCHYFFISLQQSAVFCSGHWIKSKYKPILILGYKATRQDKHKKDEYSHKTLCITSPLLNKTSVCLDQRNWRFQLWMYSFLLKYSTMGCPADVTILTVSNAFKQPFLHIYTPLI